MTTDNSNDAGENAHLSKDDDFAVTQFAKSFGLTRRQVIDLVDATNGDLADATLKNLPKSKILR